jgi:uncharacterized protein YndB with AHSA1/START domain
MPYSFTLTTTIPASPQEVYEAWLDSLAHSEMTGGSATMSGEVGAEVSAWDNYIIGRNIELVPGERIVQSWRTSEFEDEHEDSIITLTLEPVEEGTLLTLEHSNVPDEQRSYEEGGWQENYFEPMVAYFSERRLVATEPEEEEAAPAEAPPETPLREPERAAKSKRRSQPKPQAPEPEPETKAPPKKKVASKKKAAAKKKSAPKRAVKSARKAKRPAKPKRAAPRAKTPAKKRKTSGKAASAAGRKRAKATRRKSARKRR